ncbi:MAG: HD domain-containing protein [Gemmatimonadetes bacterium]|nr:HD domain-containing protein [Gemmatimonadota bacterium]
MPDFPEWTQATPERRAHVERVAALANSWADAMNTPAQERERWLRAVYLHDSLRDAPLELLTSLTDDRWHWPSLLHGPAAAEYAARHGERDRGVLDAVRYHSVGYAGWDVVGRMLYLADYLEPGREFRDEERRDMAARVPREPRVVLKEVAAERLHWLVTSGWPFIAETVEFWNALARGS